MKRIICNNSTQTEHKRTPTDDSITEYTYQKASEKTQEQTNGTQGKSNSSPYSGPALKAATLEIMRKDENKKKRRERETENNRKKKLKQQYMKEQAQKENTKSRTSSKQSIFCLHKDDEVVDIEDDSVVFTDSSSSDHLPVGSLLFFCFCCFTSQVNSYGHRGTVSSPNHTFSWASLNKISFELVIPTINLLYFLTRFPY